jgi:hypothetical protein
MKEKRGVSAVVATMLLVVLTLALAVMVSTVVIPFVRESLKSSTECSPYKNYYTFDSSFDLNCFDLSGPAKISIKTAQINPDVAKKVKGMQFVFTTSGGLSESVKFFENSPGTCLAGDIIGYEAFCPTQETLKLPKLGESLSYKYFPKGSIQGYVSVFPILDNQRTCEASDRIKLVSCT